MSSFVGKFAGYVQVIVFQNFKNTHFSRHHLMAASVNTCNNYIYNNTQTLVYSIS